MVHDSHCFENSFLVCYFRDENESIHKKSKRERKQSRWSTGPFYILGESLNIVQKIFCFRIGLIVFNSFAKVSNQSSGLITLDIFLLMHFNIFHLPRSSFLTLSYISSLSCFTGQSSCLIYSVNWFVFHIPPMLFNWKTVRQLNFWSSPSFC